MMYDIGFVSCALQSYGFITSLTDTRPFKEDYFFHYSKLDNNIIDKYKTYKKISKEISGKLVFFDRDWSCHILRVSILDDILAATTSEEYAICVKLIKEQIKKGYINLYLSSFEDKKGVEHWEICEKSNNYYNLRSFVEGSEYYVRDKLGDNLHNPEAWLSYMKQNDPQGNIFELFVKRFQTELIVNDCENDLFYKLLFTHNSKWRTDEEGWHKLPVSLRPVFDEFYDIRKYGYLNFGGDLKHRYQISKRADQRTLKALLPLAEGELTKNIISQIKSMPDTLVGSENPHYKTWDDHKWSRPQEASLVQILNEYEGKLSKLDKSNSVNYILNRLSLKDTYVPIIRKYIPLLCIDYPSGEEWVANNEIVKNYGWERPD